MEELKMHFITSDRGYREGEVFVYEQKFTVKDVKKAVFTATALGVYEAEINGVKIGKQMFAPGYSYYPRRVLYQTHEVSALLREGGIAAVSSVRTRHRFTGKNLQYRGF